MSSRVQDNNKGEKKVIKDPRLSSRHTLLLYFILYQLPCMPLPPIVYKLNGFNQLIWKSQHLKSHVVPGLHSGKILGTQVATEKKLLLEGEGLWDCPR